jgi:hypothetical protein
MEETKERMEDIMIMEAYETKGKIDPRKLARIEDRAEFAGAMREAVDGGWYADCSGLLREQIKNLISDRKVRAESAGKKLTRELEALDRRRNSLSEGICDAEDEAEFLGSLLLDIEYFEREEEEEEYERQYAHMSTLQTVGMSPGDFL